MLRRKVALIDFKENVLNIAMILAGGKGERFGSDIPKQFMEVLGKPVIVYTIEAFQNHSEIDLIQVVCIESHVEYLTELVNQYKLSKVKWIVKGGENFHCSVVNGIDHLQEFCKENDMVSIHFGASPFVTDDIISDGFVECEKHGNAISTTPFYLLSGIKTTEHMSNESIDRYTIACMNSPHTFKYELVKRIYEEGRKKDLLNQIDSGITNLMYALGWSIYFSKGSQTNIKITTKEDLKLFEGYVLSALKANGELNL